MNNNYDDFPNGVPGDEKPMRDAAGYFVKERATPLKKAAPPAWDSDNEAAYQRLKAQREAAQHGAREKLRFVCDRYLTLCSMCDDQAVTGLIDNAAEFIDALVGIKGVPK